MIEDILKSTRDNWSNLEELQLIMLAITEEQVNIAEQISAMERSFDATYLSEKENSYKTTDSELKAKTRILVGTDKTRLEYEFDALTNLIAVITLRVSQLESR